MKQQQVYNLKEFAARHHLESIFGAYAAHIYIDDLCEKSFIEMAHERTLFTKLVLVTRGKSKWGYFSKVLKPMIPTGRFRQVNCWSSRPSMSLLFRDVGGF